HAGDKVLYNAGVCCEEGKSIGAAIIAFNLLEKYYPNSKTTARAIARLAQDSADSADLGRAHANVARGAARPTARSRATTARATSARHTQRRTPARRTPTMR